MVILSEEPEFPNVFFINYRLRSCFKMEKNTSREKEVLGKTLTSRTTSSIMRSLRIPVICYNVDLFDRPWYRISLPCSCELVQRRICSCYTWFHNGHSVGFCELRCRSEDHRWPLELRRTVLLWARLVRRGSSPLRVRSKERQLERSLLLQQGTGQGEAW